ncbi:MAG: right-handed parallel beta-helix repeat-containing protein [Thermoplasmata archaeon]|nr:MAG: right-handed parallel beta-helix repeat-containing protein [Thermoplasmata archaeon]
MRKQGTFAVFAVLTISTLLGLILEQDNTVSGMEITGGRITSDDNWVLVNSPYYIQGDVYFENNANLTIEAGVEVIFNGSYGLYIGNGTLKALGNPSNMIKFTNSDDSFTWTGIQINSTGRATIKYCNITNATNGIYIEQSTGNEIQNCNISNVTNYGIWLFESDHNDISNNSIFSHNWYRGGIYLYSSSGNNIKNNTVRDSNSGIRLALCDYNNITSNRIFSNTDGIYLQTLSHDNNITKNNISMNSGYGVFVTSTTFDNLIYHNIFWYNTNQAKDEDGKNTWNNTYPIGGNYWSDFDEPIEGAYDNNTGQNQDIEGSDGIVDDWYVNIDNETGKSYDYYPLLEPTVTRVFAYLESPTNNSVVKPGTILDFIVVGDDIVLVNYTVDGGPQTTLLPPWDINETVTSSWSNDTHKIEIIIYDDTGNTTIFWFNITIDSILPEIDLISPLNATTIAPGVEIDLNVTDLHLSSVYYTLDGGSNINLPAPFNISTSGWEDGNRIIQVYATDAAGNLNTTWYNFTSDGTSPWINLTSPNNNSVVLPGTNLSFDITDPNLKTSTIMYWVNGVGPVPLTAPYNITTDIWDDENYIIIVSAADYLDNIRISVFNITIDSTRPEIYLISPGNNSNITKSDSLNFEIVDDNLDIVNYTVNLTQEITLPPPFDVNATASWEDGPYRIDIIAKDKAGNTNTSYYNFFMATPPAITLVSPSNNSLVRAGKVINLDIVDSNLNNTNYSINGGVNITFGPPYDLGTGTWDDGNYIIMVHARDRANNTNSRWYSISIDAHIPEVVFLSHTNNSCFRSGPILKFNISDINLVWINYSINGSPFSTFSLPYEISTAGWKDGVHSIEIVATDAVGQENISKFFIIIDHIRPTIELLSPPNGTFGEPGILINLSISDDNLEFVNYTVNDGPNQTLTSPFSIDTHSFPDGEVKLTIYAHDRAGNLNTTYYEFVFNDTTSPYIILNSPENQSYILKGTIIDFFVYDLYLKNVSYSLDGSSFVPFEDPYDINTSGWDEGTHTVVVLANDSRNNTNRSTFIFTIDTQNPVILLDPPPSNESVILPGTNLDFYIADDNLDVVNYSINDDTPLDWYFPFDIPTLGWDDGSYIIKIAAEDRAKNKNTAWFKFIIDSTPPSIQLNSPSDGSHINSGTMLDFNITDDNMNIVLYTINQGTEAAFNSPFDINTQGWDEGKYTIDIYARDMTDNTNEMTFQFTVDDTPPEAQAFVSAPEYPFTYTRIHIYFTESMDNESVERALTVTPGVNFTFDWSEDYRNLTLVHIKGMQSNIEYLVSINENATDLAGNPLYNFTGFKFNTTESIEEPKKETSTLEYWWLIPILVALLIVTIVLFILLIGERKEEQKGPVEQVEDIYLAMRAQKDIKTMEMLIKNKEALGDNVHEAEIMVRKAKEAFEEGDYNVITVYSQTLKDLVGQDVEDLIEEEVEEEQPAEGGKEEKVMEEEVEQPEPKENETDE